MRPGDVRLSSPEQFLPPWSGYARNGISLRVERQPGSPATGARVNVFDPLSNRREWFDESKLERVEQARRGHADEDQAQELRGRRSDQAARPHTEQEHRRIE